MMDTVQETTTVEGSRKEIGKEISQRIADGWEVSSSSNLAEDKVRVTFARHAK